MSLVSIWVDRDQAKVFQFTPDGLTHQEIHSHSAHHSHTHTADQMEAQRNERSFFKDLAPKLTNASEILIIGPGIAKHHFQNYLVEHYPMIAKKVRGCESVDHPTDHQIIALARKFFTTEQLA